MSEGDEATIAIHLALSARQHDWFCRAARLVDTTVDDYLRVAALRGRQRGDLIDDESDRADRGAVDVDPWRMAFEHPPASTIWGRFGAEPGSDEARIRGCTCERTSEAPRRTKWGRTSRDGYRIDVRCPLHGASARG